MSSSSAPGGLGCPAALALAAAGVRRSASSTTTGSTPATCTGRCCIGDGDVGEPRSIAPRARSARRFPALDVEPRRRFDVGNAARAVRRLRRRRRRVRQLRHQVPGQRRGVLARPAAGARRGGGAGRPAAHRPGRRPPLLPLPVRGAAARRGRRRRAPRRACWGRCRRHRRAQGPRRRGCSPVEVPLSSGVSSSMIRAGMTIRTVSLQPQPRVRRVRTGARIRALVAARLPRRRLCRAMTTAAVTTASTSSSRGCNAASAARPTKGADPRLRVLLRAAGGGVRLRRASARR